MNRILFVGFCLCVASTSLAQPKSCDSIVEEGVKLDAAQIEAEIFAKITQNKKTLAVKFIKVSHDIFEKVDEYRGKVIVGSSPQIILDAAVNRYKATFNGVYCQSGQFKSAMTGVGSVEEQSSQFTDNAMRVVRNGGCAKYAYYQMFAHKGSFAKLKIGRVYPFDLNEDIQVDFIFLTHHLDYLFSENIRKAFLEDHVARIFVDEVTFVGEQTIKRVQNELRSHYCPENLNENYIRGHVWRAVDKAVEHIARKFISKSPKRWDRGASNY